MRIGTRGGANPRCGAHSKEARSDQLSRRRDRQSTQHCGRVGWRLSQSLDNAARRLPPPLLGLLGHCLACGGRGRVGSGSTDEPRNAASDTQHRRWRSITLSHDIVLIDDFLRDPKACGRVRGVGGRARGGLVRRGVAVRGWSVRGGGGGRGCNVGMGGILAHGYAWGRVW